MTQAALKDTRVAYAIEEPNALDVAFDHLSRVQIEDVQGLTDFGLVNFIETCRHWQTMAEHVRLRRKGELQ